MTSCHDRNDEKKHRKIYLQQQRREKLRMETIQLREIVAELHLKLTALKRTKGINSLTWREIAKAMDDDVVKLTKDNISLKKKILVYEQAMVYLRQWMQKSMLHSPRTFESKISINQMGLVAHPTSRQYGYDWLTKVLYHNTHSIIDQYGLDSIKPVWEPRGSFRIDSSNEDSIRYVISYEVDLPVALDKAVKWNQYSLLTPIQENGFNSIDDEITESICPTMKYIQICHEQGNSIQILHRQFPETNRCVIVNHEIVEDEKFPQKRKSFMKTLKWMVFDSYGTNWTRMRIIFINSNIYTRNGPYSLQKEAAAYGLNLNRYNEQEHFNRYESYMMKLGTQTVEEECRRLIHHLDLMYLDE